jgi:PAS domain S-box-containing protein
MIEAPRETIRVLHVDDDSAFRDLTRTCLEREREQFVVETAPSASEGLARLDGSDFDCVVSDYEMPGSDGIDFLESVREEYPSLPFILYTGKGSEEVASEAISTGVTEYLQKESGTGQYAVLANRIKNAVEQYRSERALEASEKRLSLFIKQSPLGVLEYNEDFEIVQINETGQDILGYTEEELRGHTWEKLVTEESYENVDSVTDALAAAEGGYHSIDENVRKDGEKIICEWHNRVVTDEDGAVVAVFSQFQDITERVEHEQELERTNALLSTLFDTLSVGVLAETESREVLAVNEQMFEFFGLDGTPEESIGADCEELAEDVREVCVDSGEFVERINELVENGEPVHGEEIPLSDGRTLERNYKPIALPSGNGHLWVYHDVTERIEHERVIASLHETGSDFAACSTREEVYQQTVETAETLLDFDQAVVSIEEDGLLHVRAMTDEVPLEDRPTMSVDQGLAGRTYRTGESFLVDDARTDDRTDPQSAGIRGALSVPIGDRGVFQVVADRPGAFGERSRELAELLVQQTERALDRLDWEQSLEAQNERLEEFTSFVSHDLRNPLNVASARLELAADESESDHLDDVARAHERMERLIESLLTLAREGEGASQQSPVDLADVVRSCWGTVSTADATIENGTAGTVVADRSRLKQLIENLLRNAVEHGGGDVTVTVGELEDGFYVEDDGCGIPESRYEEVFEPGYSTADGGTGLGLRIVEEIADAHGWTVRVTEGSAGGTRFEITGVEFD